MLLPLVHIPLLLAELVRQGPVLCLEDIEPLAQPLDLALEQDMLPGIAAGPHTAAAGSAAARARRE